MERLDRTARRAHLANSTCEQYARWVEQFLCFHRDLAGDWVAPANLRGEDVAAFLTHMAVEPRAAYSRPVPNVWPAPMSLGTTREYPSRGTRRCHP